MKDESRTRYRRVPRAPRAGKQRAAAARRSAGASRAPKRKSVELQERAAKENDSRLLNALLAWESLDPPRQMDVLSALMVTRAREIKRAFPAIRGIGVGRRSKSRGRISTDELSVAFRVMEKRKQVAVAERLPEYLWTYWPLKRGGSPTLLAIPTDVLSYADSVIQPLSKPEWIGAAAEGFESQRGVLTTLVEIPGVDGEFALGCHHVLALASVARPIGSAVVDAETYRLTNSHRLADRIGTLEYFGRLQRPSDGLSFDGALTRIESGQLEAARVALGDRPTEWADSIPDVAVIRTPKKDVSVIKQPEYELVDDVPYFPSGPQPEQAGVLEWKLAPGEFGRPVQGDSGSPVVAEVDGREVLCGMLIGGSKPEVPRSRARFYSLIAGALRDFSNWGGVGSLEII